MNHQLQRQVSALRYKAPLAWAKVDAALGQGAETFFGNANLPESRLQLAAQLIRSLGAAAESANYAGSESAEHVAWRARLADVAALLRKIDGVDGVATEPALKARLTAALARTDLSGGQLALAKQLTVPPEPKTDAALADAVAAAQLFFGA